MLLWDGIPMKKNKLIFCLLFALTWSAASLFAVNFFDDMQDSFEIRTQIRNTWLSAKISALQGREAQVFVDSSGAEFQVRFENYGEECAIIVAPCKEEKVFVYSGAGETETMQKTYPAESRGSWILYRKTSDGSYLSLRYYFSADSQVYVQFRPSDRISSEKSAGDFVVFGETIARSVPVGLPFESLLTMSFATMRTLTDKSFPWADDVFYYELYDGSRQMIAVIRENLFRFRYMESIAEDEEGNTVYINKNEVTYVDLSPAFTEKGDEVLYQSSVGFVKWIADGLVRPVSSSGVLINPLFRSTVGFRPGSLAYSVAEDYNTMLALDWTRNLAAAVVSVLSSNDYSFEESGVLVNKKIIADAYSEVAGYSVPPLKTIMYMLAIQEPGRFYLGALRHVEKAEQEIVVYNEAAAFFPIFDRNGRFSVIVFKDGKELTIEEFVEEYKDESVQLVRLNSSEQFFPR